MDVSKLIEKIDKALVEVDELVDNSNFYRNDAEPVKSTKFVLNLLKEETINHKNNINVRVLRAMHDLGMSSYKDFENTPLQNALTNVTSYLYNNIPDYKHLAPLRMDFGKEYPI